MQKKLFPVRLLRKLDAFYRTREDVIDIVLFGSAARGKMVYRDVDILLLFARKENVAAGRELEKIFRQFGVDAEVTTATWHDFFTPSFLPRENIFLEGVSLVNRKKISEGIGYEGFVLFQYSLQGFTKTKRIRFFYALMGRKGGTGLLAKVGYRLGRDTIFIKVDHVDEFKEFLAQWEVKYREFEALLPKRRLVLLTKRQT